MDWKTLNNRLRVADEKECASLLAAELAGPRRRSCLLRIHGRLDRLRRERERKELSDQSIGR